jgi:ABC-type branched-subunit amino acid transport system substrate-binding protein
MIAILTAARKALRPVLVILAALALSACEPVAFGAPGDGARGDGGRIQSGAPVRVALLVPQSDSGAAPVAASLENAARLAVAQNAGVPIDLRVYDTAGQPATAAAQAQRAVDEGARIILGPLFGEAANAAGLAVVDEGVNVVSFSNNPSIAGGNVFVLGPTFANTANRLMAYAKDEEMRSVVILHSDDVPGRFGRGAIEQAAARNGLQVVRSVGYPLSIEGVDASARSAGSAVAAGADSIFLTTDATNAAMPMLLQTLPESGADPAQTQYIGLTRWDVRPDLFSLPGAEGAWFTLPKRARQAAFNQAYRNSYGSAPHPLGGLGYDGVAMVAQLAAQGRSDPLSTRALTRRTGFDGTGGLFRLTANGANERALAVATIRNNQVVIIDPAPSSFGGAGL